MDSMELERERGITIQSAATFANWTHTKSGEADSINIIDTPGHVDFTIEVERSLRVLDGAILVLTGVEGVQSQSITVDRQMKRYHVPRVVFVNKCDRSGANPLRVAVMLKEKLNHKPCVMQIPIGLEDQLKGVVDLVEMKAYYFEGANGDDMIEKEIPAELVDQANEYREKLIDCCADYSDEIMEKAMEGQYGVDEIDKNLIKATIRKATISLEVTPVFMGSAHKNVGVQKLLDGVIDYLPNPTEVENKALDLDNNEAEVVLKSEDNAPLVCYAFKLVNDGRHDHQHGHRQEGVRGPSRAYARRRNGGHHRSRCRRHRCPVRYRLRLRYDLYRWQEPLQHDFYARAESGDRTRDRSQEP